MDCIGCGEPGTRIKESMDSGPDVRRKRTCDACGGYFFSDEVGDDRTYRGPARSPRAQEKAKFGHGRPVSAQEKPPPIQNPTPRADSGSGGVGGGLPSDPDPDRKGSSTEVDRKGIWSPSDWCRKYGIAWTGKYQKFYGSASDPKACSILGELLERLPRAEVMAAQAIAATMFRRFLASEKPSVVDASHPFAFFVTDFGSLRLDPGTAETGGRKVPEYG